MKKQSAKVQRVADHELAELDQEFVVDKFRPLTPGERQRWAKAKRGRPKVGEGVAVISVSVEKSLLKRADRLAAKLKVPRAVLIARGLNAALAMYGGPREK